MFSCSDLSILFLGEISSHELSSIRKLNTATTTSSTCPQDRTFYLFLLVVLVQSRDRTEIKNWTNLLFLLFSNSRTKSM